MEQAPLIDSALVVIFFVNDTENGRHPKPSQDLLTSADLHIAFAEAEAHPSVDLDVSLDRMVSTLARRNKSATCELVEGVQAVNWLRRAKGIDHLIPDEHKYQELLEQTEQKERQKAQAKRISEMVGHEERARRRDGLRTLECQLDKKTRELATTQDSLRREQVYAKRLERSLECQICR